MAEISVNQIAGSLGSTSVLDMARKAGLGEPPPPISVRDLARRVGLPLQPTNLRLLWGVDVAGHPDYHPPNEGGVPLKTGVEFDWDDPSGATIRRAKTWQLNIKVAATGKDFGDSPISTKPGLYGRADFSASTGYSWNVVPFNDFGQGPSSPVFTFHTAPAAEPAPAPQKPPVIDVVYTPPPSSAKFKITGTGFVPNRAVHIRGVNDTTGESAFEDTKSDGTGAIDFTKSIPCVTGTKLSFSANDGRPNPRDLTGTLWSNTVTKTAS